MWVNARSGKLRMPRTGSTGRAQNAGAAPRSEILGAAARGLPIRPLPGVDSRFWSASVRANGSTAVRLRALFPARVVHAAIRDIAFAVGRERRCGTRGRSRGPIGRKSRDGVVVERRPQHPNRLSPDSDATVVALGAIPRP